MVVQERKRRDPGLTFIVVFVSTFLLFMVVAWMVSMSGD
jgi:hypothetical protein